MVGSLFQSNHTKERMIFTNPDTGLASQRLP